ncbi:MAG: hypothetical protein AAFZ38_00725 [Myxococcota bacterium]
MKISRESSPTQRAKAEESVVVSAPLPLTERAQLFALDAYAKVCQTLPTADAGMMNMAGLGVWEFAAYAALGVKSGAGALASALGMVKGSLASAVALEFVAAKTVNHQLTTRLRQTSKPIRPFYVNMARAGLESGLRGESRRPHAVLGGVSLGATGYTDYIAGQMLGSQIRRMVHEHPIMKSLRTSSAIDSVRLESWTTAIVEVGVEAVAKRIRDPGGGFKSPTVRHLMAALRGEHDAQKVESIQRRLTTTETGLPMLGTVAGHTAAGGLVGLALGDVALGLLVGVADSIADAFLLRAALQGRFETLAKLKAQAFSNGWERKDDTVTAHLANFYEPMRKEAVGAGSDLRSLGQANVDAFSGAIDEVLRAVLISGCHLGLEASAVVATERLTCSDRRNLGALRALMRVSASRASAPAGRVLGERIYCHLAVGDRLERLSTSLMKQISEDLSHASSRKLVEVLKDDFPELQASGQWIRAATLASMLVTLSPQADLVATRMRRDENVVAISTPLPPAEGNAYPLKLAYS